MIKKKNLKILRMYFLVYTHTKKVVYKSEYIQYIIRDYVKIN